MLVLGCFFQIGALLSFGVGSGWLPPPGFFFDVQLLLLREESSSKHYESILTLLQKPRRFRMHPESDIPGDVFCNAMLAHAVMPTLAEITAAQKADPKLQAVRKYICKKPSDRDETELPEEYRQHAQYVQLHDDALYYRDIQNDGATDDSWVPLCPGVVLV